MLCMLLSNYKICELIKFLAKARNLSCNIFQAKLISGSLSESRNFKATFPRTFHKNLWMKLIMLKTNFKTKSFINKDGIKGGNDEVSLEKWEDKRKTPGVDANNLLKTNKMQPR